MQMVFLLLKLVTAPRMPEMTPDAGMQDHSSGHLEQEVATGAEVKSGYK